MEQLKNPEIAAMVAWKFQRKNVHMEYDDLHQEALQAVWLSETDGHYDPYKSCRATFSTTCTTRALLTYVQNRNRKHPTNADPDIELEEILDSATPSPENILIFYDLMRSLPDDAKTVVRLALSDASAIRGLGSRVVQTVVRIARSLSWEPPRLIAAYDAIVQMLQIAAEI